MDPVRSWARWRHSDVVDVSGADLVVRNYLEQRDVRKYLELASSRIPMQVACDFGCGFARMTMVLGEFCSRVIGIEREPELIEDVRRLQPRVRAVQVLSLGQLPLETGSCDFVLSFTVLQHLVDAEAERAIAELKRILRSGGHALLCEETDACLAQGTVHDPSGKCTIGRSVETYQGLLAPLALVESSPRRIEPGYPRPDVGRYMLFQAG